MAFTVGQENSISVLDGLYKRVYAKRAPEKPIPDFALLQAMIPFSEKEKVGERYELPVVVALEQGVTYGDPASDGAFALSAPKPGQLKPAYVSPFEIVLRSAISYSAAHQAKKKGEAAFKSSTSLLLESMNETMRRRVEISLLGYGRDGIGVISSGGGTTALVITDAEWAPGLWFGMVGAELEIFSAKTASSTKRTYAGALNTYTVTAVNISTKTITVDNGTGTSNGDVLQFRTQKTATAYKDLLGLKQIATTSGTLFGIVNTTYDVFAGITYDVGSTDLSVDSIEKACAQLAVRGGSGKMVCLISPRTFANVVSDLAALVAYDQKAGDKSYSIGASSVTIYTPSGEVAIKTHEMLKEGEGYIFQPKRLMRSGATDITFNRNFEGVDGKVNGSYFTELADNAGFELRCYSNQFLFCPRPSTVLYLQNIVNS